MAFCHEAWFKFPGGLHFYLVPLGFKFHKSGFTAMNNIPPSLSSSYRVLSIFKFYTQLTTNLTDSHNALELSLVSRPYTLTRRNE